MSVFLIPITGRLIDPLGDPITGANVYFTSKATTRGAESVPQTADAYFTTDAGGYYSAALATGWYKIYLQEADALEPTKIGVATASGIDPVDLGSLIANSIPPPSEIQQIGNVDSAGLANGSLLVYNANRQKWITTVGSGNFATTSALGSLSGVYNAGFAAFPTVTGTFTMTGGAYRYLWTGTANTTGTAILPPPALYGGQMMTVKNISSSPYSACLISGNVDYFGNYLLYGGACANMMSDSNSWLLISTCFSLRINA